MVSESKEGTLDVTYGLTKGNLLSMIVVTLRRGARNVFVYVHIPACFDVFREGCPKK